MRPLLGVTLVLLAMCACKRETIVGDWTALDGRPFTMSLRTDGSFTMSVQAGGMDVDLVGQYTLEENRLKVTGLKSPMAGGMFGMPGMAPGLDEDIDCTFAWKNKEEIVLSGNPILAGSYRRKK